MDSEPDNINGKHAERPSSDAADMSEQTANPRSQRRSSEAPCSAAKGKMHEKEIPYNPPGMDEYIREGARHNQRLLDKWKKEATICPLCGHGQYLINGKLYHRCPSDEPPNDPGEPSGVKPPKSKD